MRKTVDLLLENGRIYTMVSEGDCVEALCVKNGVIVYTGTAAEAERLYDAAEVVDLGGRVMLPGMGGFEVKRRLPACGLRFRCCG